jgi:hypothetical protein
MKRMHYIIVISVALIGTGCVSIPESTATLTQEVIKEAATMHQFNIALVNKLFEERKLVINSFITNQYTPPLIKKYEDLLPDSLNYKEKLPNIIKSIIPVINRKKDSLQNVLSGQQQELISNLNDNYQTYSKASATLQNVINSAVKLKSVEQDTLSSTQKLTGDMVDVKKVDSTIDGLLIKAGSDMSDLSQVKTKLKSN